MRKIDWLSDNNETNFKNLLYGALFHDIGKFYQRTRDKQAEKEIFQDYKWYVESLGRDYLSHEQWSAYFIRTVLKMEAAATLALKHHHPETDLEYLIAIADKLSAMERDEEGPASNGKANVAAEPLCSVLSSIRHIRDDSEPAISFKRLKFEPLVDPYPVSDKKAALSPGDYQAWWECFATETKETVKQPVGAGKQFHRLYQLLYQYTQTVPSAAYYSKPTISLFDHSRTTAAIATALYRQGLSQNDLERLHRLLVYGGKKRGAEEPVLLLVGGDISGIQDFVFDVSAKGAAKGLRGRSYYLATLGEAIAQFILTHEGLTPCNILYSGGGHFYLILPVRAMSRLADYQKQIDQILFAAHQGKLSVILTGIPLTQTDFYPENFGEKWQQIGLAAQKAKQQKFLELIRQNPEQVLGPSYEGQQVCVICGSSMPVGEEKCSFCESFEQLGDNLARERTYLLEYYFKPRPVDKLSTVEDVWAGLGYRLEFSNKPDAQAIVSVINQPALADKAVDRVVWLANTAPHNPDGSLLTFEEIAAQSTGDHMWGVLRGDVDNLGRVFREGLGQDRSISKIAALSREMSFFFSFIFNQVCLRYRQSVYVIYAGGDDFFLVGAWSDLPTIAAEINREFHRYSSGNPNLTLSCAISIASGMTYPLFKVAHTAGEQLDEQAKTTRMVKGVLHHKDSVCFLGQPFTWGELEEVRQVKNLIKKAIQNEGVAKSLIFLINTAYAEQRQYQQGRYPINRIWRLVYALTRLAARHGQAANTLKELESRLLTSQTMLYANSLYAARWAEKELRTRGD